MLAAYYGSSHFARISSIMAIFLTVTSTAAPVGASFVYDRFGTYQPVLIVIFCLSVIATGIMAMLRHQPVTPQKFRE